MGQKHQYVCHEPEWDESWPHYVSVTDLLTQINLLRYLQVGAVIMIIII